MRSTTCFKIHVYFEYAHRHSTVLKKTAITLITFTKGKEQKERTDFVCYFGQLIHVKSVAFKLTSRRLNA